MKCSVDSCQLFLSLVLLLSLNVCSATTSNKELPRSSSTFPNSTIHSTVLADRKSHVVDSSASSTSTSKTSTRVTSTSSSKLASELTTTAPTSKSTSPTPSTNVVTGTPTTNSSSTITAAPFWGNQSIPLNTCSVWQTSESSYVWTPCHIFAGTVQLSYFPENSLNHSYPTTYYDPTLSLVLTSPSIYMVVNTITGDNSCGPLGPTYATQVISMDLTDVFTIQPYASKAATTRMGAPIQLTLSDLENCPSYKDISTTGEIVNTHPVDNTYNRCNPRLVFPIQLKRLGYPYWKHCGNKNYVFGIFDPPGAVPTVESLFVSTAAVIISSTTEPAIPAPTAAQDQVSSTSMSRQEATPASESPVEATSTPSAAISNSESTQSVGAPVQDSSAIIMVVSGGINSAGALIQSTTSNQPSVIAVVGTQTINAIVGSSGVILPNGSTASVGSVATLTDSSGSKAVLSVGTSGVYIGSGSSTTFFANPTATAQAAAPVSTAIATIAGQVISAAAGDSVIVIGDHTITSGGAAVTLPGTNNVATLGPQGLVIQYSAGSVATYSIPKPTPSVALLSGAVGGIAFTASAGDSILVIGSQTLTNGGAVHTLPNNEVVSLGPSGVVVQYPGGAVSTILLSATKTAKTASSSGQMTSTSSQGVAVAIVSMIGGTTSSSTSPDSASISRALTSGSMASISTPIAAPLATSSGSRMIKNERTTMIMVILLPIFAIFT